MQKWIYKWKVHFQYLLSLGLLSANERPPNALNDACRLLFKKKIFIQSEKRTVHETSLFSLFLLFLFSFITFLRCMSLICDIHLRHVRCITLTALCVYVSWKCMFGNWYLLLDYSYYIPVKRRPTKVQILEENG